MLIDFLLIVLKARRNIIYRYSRTIVSFIGPPTVTNLCLLYWFWTERGIHQTSCQGHSTQLRQKLCECSIIVIQSGFLQIYIQTISFNRRLNEECHSSHNSSWRRTAPYKQQYGCYRYENRSHDCFDYTLYSLWQ